MPDRGIAIVETRSVKRRREILHIDDDGGRGAHAVAFVEFIIDVEVLAFRIEPTLVAVAATWICRKTKLNRQLLVGDIDDVKPGVCVATVAAAAAECDLLARIYPRRVLNDLALVDVNIRPLANILRRAWRVVEVVDSQSARATARAIEITARIVDCERVRCRRGCRRRENRARKPDDPLTVETRDVEDLNTAAAFACRVAIEAVRAHIAPQAGRTRHEGGEACRRRIRDVHERGARVEADDRVLVTVGKHITPAAVCVGATSVECVERKPRLQLDVA